MQKNYQDKGLASEEVERRSIIYGLNEHKVKIPNVFEFMFEKLIGPFAILQYIFSIAYILTRYPLFGGILLFLIVLTTFINYILVYISYQKIKEISDI